MAESGMLGDAPRLRTLMIEEIHQAFGVVFPEERLEKVEYEREEAREIFRITSNVVTRVYMRADTDISFEDILRNTPHLDQKSSKS